MVIFCLNYLKKYKFKLILYLVLTLIMTSLSTILPLITGKIIDSITILKNHEILLQLCLIFAVMQITNIFLQFITNREYMLIQTETAYSINLDLIGHVQKLPISKTSNLESGYLTQQINNDSNAITIFVINLLNNVVTNTVVLMFSIYILFKINNMLGIFLMGLCIFYLLLYIIGKNKLFSMSLLLKEQQASFFSDLLLQFKNIKFVKIHSLYNLFLNKLNSSFKIYLNNVMKSQVFFYFFSCLESIIIVAASIFVYMFGGLCVIEEKISIGEFTIIISFFGFVLSSVKYFGDLGKNYQDNLVSYERLMKILNQKQDKNGKTLITKINTITCENLSFSYVNNILFNNFNYSFERGKSYCICGKNGAGKTTLIDLLIGLHLNEYTGNIKYNSIDISQLDMNNLRKMNISFLEQNPIFFRGNIEENIYMTPEYKRENINKYITKFTGIGEKRINDDSSGVSGGEAQKIALLRLLSKNADVFIMDEPSSALDTDNKVVLRNLINILKQEKILIVVTHDEDLINECDYKVVL